MIEAMFAVGIVLVGVIGGIVRAAGVADGARQANAD